MATFPIIRSYISSIKNVNFCKSIIPRITWFLLVGSEVFNVTNTKTALLRCHTSSLVQIYQCIRTACCLHFQDILLWRWKQQAALKHWQISARLFSMISQGTVTFFISTSSTYFPILYLVLFHVSRTTNLKKVTICIVSLWIFKKSNISIVITKSE